MTYKAVFDSSSGPEDCADGRCYEVIQYASNGNYVKTWAGRCTQEDAERIATCLSSCAGFPSESLYPQGLIK